MGNFHLADEKIHAWLSIFSFSHQRLLWRAIHSRSGDGKETIRFLHHCFSPRGIMAVSDHRSNIFIINFERKRFIILIMNMFIADSTLCYVALQSRA